jgi:predicted methyltransferase
MTRTWIAAAALGLAACATGGAPPPALDAAALLADPARPEADRARDADRKPAELIAFAGVRPGHRIAELAPGGGYFTRLLTAAVGPDGKVYAIATRPAPAVEEWARGHSNVILTVGAPGTIAVPEPVDIVWTTNNYHDFKNVALDGGDGAAAVNRAAFAALKPGGLYLVADHAAAAGAGPSQTSSLHRIEPPLVRREVESAGFVLDARSDLLRHPADDHSLKVQESGIRGKTDQFVFRFRKPRR